MVERDGVSAAVAVAAAVVEDVELDELDVDEEADVADVDDEVEGEAELSATTVPGVHWLHAGPDQSITPWSPQAGGRGEPVTSTTSPTRLKL